MITTKERTFKAHTDYSGFIQAEILFTVEVGDHGTLLSAEVDIVESTNQYGLAPTTESIAEIYRNWRDETLDEIVEEARQEIEQERALYQIEEDINPHNQIRLELAAL